MTDANVIRWCLLEGRKVMYEAHRLDCLRMYADDGFDDFEEMQAWMGEEPVRITYDDVMAAGQARVETAAQMRAYVAEHGAKWRESVRERWLARAAELEAGTVDAQDRERWQDAGSPAVLVVVP